MTFLLVTAALLAAMILVWQIGKRRTSSNPTNQPTYTCHVCGEQHCDCQVEKE